MRLRSSSGSLSARTAIAEAETLLAQAQEAARVAAAAERARVETKAQADHDKEQGKVVAALVRGVDSAIGEAGKLAKGSTVSRGAAIAARMVLTGGGGQVVDVASLDEATGVLWSAFLDVGRAFNNLTGQRPHGRRDIGPELGQRLVDLERKVWGALWRRVPGRRRRVRSNGRHGRF